MYLDVSANLHMLETLVNGRSLVRTCVTFPDFQYCTRTRVSHMISIGMHEIHGRMHPNLFAHDPISLPAYPIITYAQPVAGNLTYSCFKHTHTHTHTQ